MLSVAILNVVAPSGKTGKKFHPSHTFAGEARSLPSGERAPALPDYIGLEWK
jgi:hypothetical protein